MRAAAALLLASLASALLAACSSSQSDRSPPGPAADNKAASLPPGSWKLGRPYRINGKWYHPRHDPTYSRTGTASWYGSQFHGLATANGETFDKEQVSAAHPTLPLPSIVKVTNLDNGRELVVRVNDRGPFHDDRVIDLSQAAARELGYERSGLARVRVDFVEIDPAAMGVPAGTVMVASASPPAAPTPPPAPAPALFDDPTAPAATVTAVALPPPPASAEQRIQLASLGEPTLPAAVCRAGPHLVQVGAFTDTARVRAASARVAGLAPLRMEPIFIGERAAMRVRVGPAADRGAGERLLAKVRAQGYAEAYLVPVDPTAPIRPC